ncbi:MAG: DUF535 family protein [Roseiarcus sp.]|jgi:uncharacterized protein VirK/YbjX
MIKLQPIAGPTPGAPPKARKAFRNYLLRSLLAPVSSARWRRYIRALYRAVAAAPPPVRVLAKPVRRYVHRDYWPRQRLALLFEHYRWLRALFSRDFLARLFAEAPLPVVELSGRRGGEYALFVIAANVVYMQREGELAIVVAKRSTGRELSRLSLCFARVDGEPAIVVGGLQGPASIFKRDVIDATRDLYGLRPKDAALLAARAMGRALGFKALHGVCDANHVLRRLQNKTKFSRYDAYWSERGGKRGGPFGFVFGPLEASAPSGDRRDATKAAIVAGMEAFVAAHRAPRRPPYGDL